MNTCPNCGKQLEENETICSNCGVNILEDATNNVETENINVNVNTGPYKPKRFVSQMKFAPNLFKDDDDEFYLLDVYIAQNIAKMKTGFSWNTFFFSFIYMFYRKMWALGIFTIFLNGFIYYFIKNPMIVFPILFVYNIVIAFMFKDLYLKHALKTIDDIKKENPNKTDEELVPIVKKKGGTSAIVLFIIIVSTVITVAFNITLIIKSLRNFGDFSFDFIKGRLDNSKEEIEKLNE